MIRHREPAELTREVDQINARILEITTRMRAIGDAGDRLRLEYDELVAETAKLQQRLDDIGAYVANRRAPA